MKRIWTMWVVVGIAVCALATLELVLHGPGLVLAGVQAQEVRMVRPVPPQSAMARLVPPVTAPERSDSEDAADGGGQVPSTAQPNDSRLSAPAPLSASRPPTYYVVAPGDTLNEVAVSLGIEPAVLIEVNRLANTELLYVGQILAVPGGDGSLPDPSSLPFVTAEGAVSETLLLARGTITERLTNRSRQVDMGSPYYDRTWVTYYGRPDTPVMGILGEYPVAELVPLLQKESDAYDAANGDELAVQPAFHLVYGMATKAAGDDGSHLAFLEDEVVMEYIEAAAEEDYGVILDVQIGALTPTAAISRGLAYLQYDHVHLAIDPEFAMVHKNQVWPGNPIGFVTADQINEVQVQIAGYMKRNGIRGPRILLVHQFQQNMIERPEAIDTEVEGVELTISVDGWGGPWGKISKYNAFVTPETSYAAFKLFYSWDAPLLSPYEALGVVPYTGTDFFIDVTPNMIIYQ